MATALGKLGNSPTICQPCAKKIFLNKARLLAVPRCGTWSGNCGNCRALRAKGLLSFMNAMSS